MRVWIYSLEIMTFSWCISCNTFLYSCTLVLWIHLCVGVIVCLLSVILSHCEGLKDDPLEGMDPDNDMALCEERTSLTIGNFTHHKINECYGVLREFLPAALTVL